MANIIKMTIQLRRDTLENWQQYKDIIPAIGEPCFITDKNILKIGDGKTTFENLVPINGVQFAADGETLVLKDGVLKLNGFDEAKEGAQLVKGENGTIQWVVPSTDTVDGLKVAVGKLQTDVASITSDVGVLKTDVDGLKAIVGSYDGESETLLSRVEELEKEMDAFITGVGDNDEKINTLVELVNYIDKHGKEAADIVSDIATLYDLVGKDSVADQINTAVSGKVDKVDGMGLSSNDFTDSLLDKLNGIEENAQVNIIEGISVGGTMIDIINKVADIPVAGLDRFGVVKSSTGANKVNISNNGEMSVNKINVNSIFVPIGEELVLDGGNSNGGTPVYPTRIGNVGYNSISDAVNYADNGDIVVLQEDVNMGAGDNDHLVVNTENATINLGGKTLTANGSNGAIKVEGGIVTLDGEGTVSGTLGSDKYSMAVWASNGKVIINNGIYRNETDGSDRGTDLIYASGTGCIEINGGTFEAAKPEWTLNCKDADYKAGTAKIIVKGGSFKGFDPANNKSESIGTNFVADGYTSVKEGDYYVVKPI